MEFDIGDIVQLRDGYILEVTGVIHDDERLFVTGDDGIENEEPFNQVIRQWKEKAL